MDVIGYVWGRELDVKVGTYKAREVFEENDVKPVLVCHLYQVKALISESPALSFQEPWSHTGQGCCGQPCSYLWPLSLPSPSPTASGP